MLNIMGRYRIDSFVSTDTFRPTLILTLPMHKTEVRVQVGSELLLITYANI